MAGIILSVDLGTSSLKAAYIDLNGRMLGYIRLPYSMFTKNTASRLQSLDDGHIVQSWKEAFNQALIKLHRQVGQSCTADAVCISGNGPTLAPLHEDYDAMSPLFWYDNNVEQSEEEGDFHSFFLPKVAWLKKNQPEQYKKTDLFLSPHEWLAYRLGAEPLAVLPSLTFKPYFWDDRQCDAFGVDKNKFPPFVTMGSLIGKVESEIPVRIANTNLKRGTPIIAGGIDFISALIGTATFRPGDVLNRAGSSEGINVCSAHPVDAPGIRSLPHVKEGLWNISKLIPMSGRRFDLYKTASGQADKTYKKLLKELIPSLTKMDVFKSIPLDEGRAVLRDMGFAVRDAVGELIEHGVPVKRMVVSGGQAKNHRWNHLKANITGLQLLVPEIPDGELAGNAVIAAVALGESRTIEEAAGKMVKIDDVYVPRYPASSFWAKSYSARQEH
ncbi:MAG: FGGY-family carbohydrate kinase [Treponema sp.]|nr:FGGY-family carbohydrate kinase [Treponema sp.]